MWGLKQLFDEGKLCGNMSPKEALRIYNILCAPTYSVLYSDTDQAMACLVDQGRTILAEEDFNALVAKVSRFYDEARRQGVNIADLNSRPRETVSRQVRPPAARTTLAGYVYLFKDRYGLYKIGRSVDPWQRAKNISQPNFPIDVICTIKTNNMAMLEQELHGHFAETRVEGEWFKLNGKDINYIKRLEIKSWN